MALANDNKIQSYLISTSYKYLLSPSDPTSTEEMVIWAILSTQVELIQHMKSWNKTAEKRGNSSIEHSVFTIFGKTPTLEFHATATYGSQKRIKKAD